MRNGDPLLLKIKDWSTTYENNRSRELKSVNYIMVPNRMDTDGYTALMDHDNAAAHLGAWIALLQIVSRSKVRGTIDISAGIPHLCARLSRISRIPAPVFEEVIPRLLNEMKWIEIKPQPGEIPHEGAIPHHTAGIPHHAAKIPQWSGVERSGTERSGVGEELEAEKEAVSTVAPLSAPSEYNGNSTGDQEREDGTPELPPRQTQPLTADIAPSPNSKKHPPGQTKLEYEIWQREQEAKGRLQ